MGLRFSYQKIKAGAVVAARPYIPVTLFGNGKRSAVILALLDSGCDGIIFPADLAISVDITDIQTGTPQTFMGFANQTSDVYFHSLSIRVLGDIRVLPVPIGFSRETTTPLLGRILFREFRSVVFKEQQAEVELII